MINLVYLFPPKRQNIHVYLFIYLWEINVGFRFKNLANAVYRLSFSLLFFRFNILLGNKRRHKCIIALRLSSQYLFLCSLRLFMQSLKSGSCDFSPMILCCVRYYLTPNSFLAEYYIVKLYSFFCFDSLYQTRFILTLPIIKIHK